MLRPKAKPPVTRVSAAREAEEAEPDLSPEGAEVAFARSAEAREHRGKRPPKEGVTTNNTNTEIALVTCAFVVSLFQTGDDTNQ